MKERPIIFSAPMVRAILDGRKTQTRRIVKNAHMMTVDGELVPIAALCPYGQPGDRLVVREKWRIGAWDEDRGAVAIDYFDGPRREWIEVPDPTLDGELFNRLWQQSTDDARAAGLTPDDDGRYRWAPGESPCRWRPSIHMPRWASRITLEITDVRVERLQDISEDDAYAEGCRPVRPEIMLDGLVVRTGRSAVDEYRQLWQSIHGPESWSANPSVWVIEFKKLEQA